MKVMKLKQFTLRHRYVTITLTTLIFFFVSIGRVSGQEPEEILAIRAIYGETVNAVINGVYQPVVVGFGEKSISFKPYVVAEIFGDPATSKIAMVKKNQTAPGYTIYTEYLYYPDGELAFVYERITLERNLRKIEHRYYLHGGKLIRYLVDLDSVRTGYNDNLSRWSESLEPFIANSQALNQSYKNSLGPMLSSSALESGKISITMKGYEDISLQMDTRSDVWNIEVVENVNAATFDEPKWENGSIIRDFSFTGGEGIKYIAEKEGNFFRIHANRYGYDGNRAYLILSLPLDSEKTVSLEIPSFNEGDDLSENDRKELKYHHVSLPRISLSQSGVTFADDDAAAVSKRADKVQVDFIEQKIFDWVFYSDSNWIEGKPPLYLRALVLPADGLEQVFIYRMVPELTQFQGESVYEAGFDVFRVNLDTVTEGSSYSIDEVEWLSADELLINLYLNGKSKEVTAIFD